MRLFTRPIFLLALIPTFLFSLQVKRVDFTAGINAAGPMLVKADPARNRIVLVNTYTSSLTLISGADHSLTNIPIRTRIPQFLKGEILTIDNRSGNIYLIGYHSLHVVFPESRTSRTFDTERQFEMVAVDEASGNAFLVGRENKALAFVQLKKNKISYIPWTDKEEKLINLNATPPPPIRKVVCDSGLQRVYALDGFTSTLAAFDATSGRLLARRPLKLVSGARWHYGGYNEKTHHLYVAVETAERKVVQAAKIDVVNGRDQIVALPELTEGVGILYSAKREELYIPYDNHPSVHVVDFKDNSLSEVRVPSYGNDSSVIDEENDLLYVSSWAWSEVEQIDLKTRHLLRRFLNVGIVPHMFSMAFNPAEKKLYIPLGADAVNGSFGSAVTVLDPASDTRTKIRAGWAPVDLIQRPQHDSFLVFNSEDEFAEVQPDGSFTLQRLPFPYPHQAAYSPEGNIYLSYGPHQSYWPVVYIWGAKNGILTINAQNFQYNDRRTPELSQGMIVDMHGVLYSLQNNWGGQKQYLISLPDEQRAPNLGDMRIELEDTVLRETTQRILKYDPARNVLYIGRIGEKDEDPGVLQIFDISARKVLARIETGLTPTDLAFDEQYIYVTNFDSHSVSRVSKADFKRLDLPTGKEPLKIVVLNRTPFVINHLDNTLQEVGTAKNVYRIPFPGLPDNLFVYGNRLLLTSHSATELAVLVFDPATKKFQTLHRESYPFGETRFDTANSAFYQRGQFGDALFEITRMKTDGQGRIWLSDFLSGKLFIISEK